ncbi:hypothetical protein QZH41_010058 [Actinostola sp. cb2023]|nr:hypothetical protein QZH41_010058 [Actinostola sp. cb2023]
MAGLGGVLRVLIITSLVALGLGHGRMRDPDSRSSCWRSFANDCPAHYTDNELNCGGFNVQWNTNNGKCGVCGDPFHEDPPKYVHPGMYATGFITKTYRKGQDIAVQVKLTSNHLGRFKFSIGDIGTPPMTNEKLTHVLRTPSGETWWKIPTRGNDLFTINLKLPSGLACNHCVLQWYYKAGNNWGCDAEGVESFNIPMAHPYAKVLGHGYILDPAARNACWQKGFPQSCGEEWTMDEKNCGAFSTQWKKNGGKCGVCGDAYHLKIQKYVYPGSHATGTITKTYDEGQEIELDLMITVTHKGWSEFRVGDIGARPITQDKLRYLLPISGSGGETRWYHNKYVKGKGSYKIKLQLPAGLTCKHCVLQWWWKTGNSWGCDDEGCGLGHGEQETFVNCADIRITSKDGVVPPVTQAPPPTQAPTVAPTQAPTVAPTQAPTVAPTQAPTDPPPNTAVPTNAPNLKCRATGPYQGNKRLDKWCQKKCANGSCPSRICACD